MQFGPRVISGEASAHAGNISMGRAASTAVRRQLGHNTGARWCACFERSNNSLPSVTGGCAATQPARRRDGHRAFTHNPVDKRDSLPVGRADGGDASDQVRSDLWRKMNAPRRFVASLRCAPAKRRRPAFRVSSWRHSSPHSPDASASGDSCYHLPEDNQGAASIASLISKIGRLPRPRVGRPQSRSAPIRRAWPTCRGQAACALFRLSPACLDLHL